MSEQQGTIDFLLGQCKRYPALCPQDLLKGLHQSVFGCGHFVSDEGASVGLIRQEASSCGGTADAVELLDGDFCRLHLGYLKENGMTPETLSRLFTLSASAPVGTAEDLRGKVETLLALARENRLPVSPEEMARAAETFSQAGFPACHHSDAFRSAYHPAYRVISRSFLWMLPLLCAIDRQMQLQPRVIVALEGCCASGKTTLAGLLAQIYECSVFHMDDFFLRPEQRTPERYAQPGGNVDRERFWAEVLQPLKQGRAVAYRRYDCQTQQLLPPVETAPKALTIVEGAYSLHPDLAPAYDLRAVLRISPALQRARIEKRNTPEMQQRFFSQWIPLEQAYFGAMDPAVRCDIILEVES